MLGSAVRREARAKEAQQKQQSLEQQLFPSSSPNHGDIKELDKFRYAGSAPQRHPLQPSPASVLNGTSKMNVKPYKLPLKRSSSSLSGGSDSNSSSKSRKIFGQSRQQNGPAGLSQQPSSRLGKLHQTTSFDEDDLIDEDELMDMASALESTRGEIKYPKLPQPEPHYPKLPDVAHKTPPVRSSAQSSSAVPWSSSPDSHRFASISNPARQANGILQSNTASSKKQLIGRQLPSDPVTVYVSSALVHTAPRSTDSGSSDILPLTQIMKESHKPGTGDSSRGQKVGYGNKNAPIELGDSPEVIAEKRRTLPWLREEERATAEVEELGSKRMRRPKKERPQPEISTPAPKAVKSESPSLWNQTASAVKAEHKKLRQQNAGGAGVKVKAQTEGEEAVAASKKAKSTAKQLSPVFLSQEQQKVLNLVVEQKKSVFFTGSAGTGKSVLMREIIANLRRKYNRSPDSVAVTASTGLAACNIGGNTLHSFAGIGLGKETAENLVKKIKKNQKTVQRWMRTKVLIIDEISMIDGGLFDKLEHIARVVRKKPQSFGGIQVVVTGDFFQLPPVGEGGSGSVFAFDAATWKTSIDHTIGLTHVFRQRDPGFAGMLNEMRVGKLTPASIKAFQKLQRPIHQPGEVFEATELFPTRREVDQANHVRMQKLIGTPVEYTALDGGSLQDNAQRDRLLANCMAPQTITFKKGAQVMLIKNIDDTLVNGSIGKVVGFMSETMFDAYDANEEEFLSSGGDLDKMEAAGLDLKAFSHNNGNNKNAPGAANTGQKYPVVRFQLPDGPTRDLLCQRETWKIEQPNGEVLASRSQVPLILAWALSIHKAQGQTLEKVKVDLGRIFEKGQAYVALSRATTQEGLQIAGFDARKVMAHDKVRRFYDTLYGIDTIGGMPKVAAPPQPPAATTASTKVAPQPANGFEGFEMTAEEEALLLQDLDC